MSTPTFSIILPVRNGGHYVKECVGSILAQSHTDFNFLVLDNCSTDGTLEWLRDQTDPRIRVFPAERPLTIEENWGRIVSLSKNEFITLIGHDDILDPQYLTVMDRLIRKHPDAGLYQTHFRYIDSEGGRIRLCKPMDEIQSAPEFLGQFLSHIIDTMGTGFMMRGRDYDEAGGIPPYPNLLFADFELWTKLSRKGYKATAFEECFAFRIHQSTTTTSPDLKYQHAFERFVAYLEELKNATPELDAVVKRYSVSFIHFYCKGLSHRLLRTPMQKRQGQTVDEFVARCRQFARRLSPGSGYEPYDNFGIRLAKYIDSTRLTRSLFLLFKKLYGKPFYK